MTAELVAYDFEAAVPLHDFQRASVAKAESLGNTHKQPRLCLYYKTGAGKTRTSLACVLVMGYTDVVIVAPPTTHQHWIDTARDMGFVGEVTVMSHAKFEFFETRKSSGISVQCLLDFR